MTTVVSTSCTEYGITFIRMTRYNRTKTFGQYVDILTESVLPFFETHGRMQVDRVFDQYGDAKGSVKFAERNRRP